MVDRKTETLSIPQWAVDAIDPLYGEATAAEPNPRDGFDKVTPKELRDFYLRIALCQTWQQAYQQLAQAAESGQPFYDLVMAPAQERTNSVLLATVREQVQARGKPFTSALDLGGGTGETAFALAGFGLVKRITIVDVIPGLLQWAAAKMAALKKARKLETYEIITADVFELPERLDGRFPLVVDSGIDAYLPPGQIKRYREAIFRCLQPGGLYIRVAGSPISGAFETSPRAQMAGLIHQTVLELTHASEYARLRGLDPKSTGASLFERTRIPVGSVGSSEVVHIWKKPK